MTDWPVKTLGEVAVVGAGNSAPQDKELFRNGVHRFVRTSDVGQVRIGRLDQSADLLNDEGTKGLRKFRAGVTLMPKSGASTFLNHRVQLTKPCFVSSHLAVVDPNPELMDDTFMFYFLQTVRSQDLIQDQSYPSLNLPAISGINVLVPPLEEQKRIGELLDAANARVAELTACYEQARTFANNLFESLYASCFEHQGAETVLGDIADLNGGYAFKSSDYTESGVFVLRTLNIDPNGNITKRKATYVSKTRMEEFDRFKLLENDILFVMVGATLGKTGVVREADLPALLNQNMWVIRAKSDLIDPQYLYFVFTRYSKSLLSGAAGAARAFVKRDDFRNLMVPVPSLEEQKKIVVQLDSMQSKTSEMVAAYDAKLTAAKNLRQSILNAAFAGDL
jgi:type I restriction enzyme S subunit